MVISETLIQQAHNGEADPRFSFGVISEDPQFVEGSIAKDREAIEITPDSLMQDNSSDKARYLNDRWIEIRNSQEQFVIDKCGDPKTFLDKPESKVVLPSIGGSGPINPFMRVYCDTKVQGIVEMSHFSSLLLVPGENPGGCVGRVVRGEQQRGTLSAEEGDTQQFVKEYVPHEDVVLNSLHRAAKIASLTGKPALAATQDHITGRVIPLAYFERKPGGGLGGETAIPYHLLFDANYDPKRIYENGIPQLSIERLPDMFAEIIIDNTEHVRELMTKYPDFTESQVVSNPRTLLLSASTKPAPDRYPNHFDLPNTYVSLVFGRERIDGEDTVDRNHLLKSLRQAHAFISRSVANHGNHNAEYSLLDKILIETSNLGLSLELASELGEKPWMREWMELSDNHRIMLAQTRGGITEKIQYLT